MQAGEEGPGRYGVVVPGGVLRYAALRVVGRLV